MAYHKSCRHTEDFVATPVLFIMKLDKAHTRNRGMGGRLDKITHIIYLETGEETTKERQKVLSNLF